MPTGLLSFRSHDGSGTLYSNTICVHSEGAGLGTTDESFHDIVEACWTWLGSTYLDCISTELVLDELYLLGVGADAGSIATHPSGAAGTAGGDGKLPRELTCTLSLRSAHAGRSGRGHIAIPSPRKSACLNSSGQWDFTQFPPQHWTTFKGKLLDGHDWDSPTSEPQHLSTRIWSRKLAQSFDVTTALLRSDPRWLESRETAP